MINLASLLIVYDYCVPVQMVMQMAMGAMQVCVSVQTFFFFFFKFSHLSYLSRLTLFDTLTLFTSEIISIHLTLAIYSCSTLHAKGFSIVDVFELKGFWGYFLRP